VDSPKYEENKDDMMRFFTQESIQDFNIEKSNMWYGCGQSHKVSTQQIQIYNCYIVVIKQIKCVTCSVIVSYNFPLIESDNYIYVIKCLITYM